MTNQLEMIIKSLHFSNYQKSRGPNSTILLENLKSVMRDQLFIGWCLEHQWAETALNDIIWKQVQYPSVTSIKLERSHV